MAALVARLAVVHDFLSQYGGAERVALAMIDSLGPAPLYTSVYQPDLTFDAFARLDVRTTFLQKIVPEGHFRYAAPLYGFAFRRVDLREFDKVLVSTSGFAHHVCHPNTFVYCHTPPRFIYRLDTYFSNKHLVTAMRPVLPWLKRADQEAARRHSRYVANSNATAAMIKAVYGRTVPVIHPPIDTDRLGAELTPPPSVPRALVLARLQPYKRVDVAIAACHQLGLELTVVGAGPERVRLEAQARQLGSATTFLGPLPDAEVGRVIGEHSVLLVPGVEDFGLTPSEANFAGRPVVARNAGGATESIKDGHNGTLVDSGAPEDWATAIEATLARSWDAQLLRASTEIFQVPAFNARIRDWMQNS